MSLLAWLNIFTGKTKTAAHTRAKVTLTQSRVRQPKHEWWTSMTLPKDGRVPLKDKDLMDLRWKDLYEAEGQNSWDGGL